MGGAIAFTNEICDLALAAELAGGLGTEEGDAIRLDLVKQAAALASARGNFIRVWLNWITVVGQFM